MAKDITEDIPYDISATSPTSSIFTPTDIAYDISVNNIPFILRASNQDPYRRETAPYKKDQFDNSAEPGEQSLTGWWIRSQTSWHHGAGTRYYEPGTNPDSQYRFWSSRGVNPWVLGEVSLLNDTFESYAGANGIVADAMNDGTNDILVSGDDAGALKKLTLNGDSAATASTYTLFTTGLANHTTGFSFKSVTNDGARYFAVCGTAIHRGNTTDEVIYQLGTSEISSAIIKFTKGELLFGLGRGLYHLDPDATAKTQHNSTLSLPADSLTHPAADWNWNAIVGGNTHIYAAGYNESTSEIWKIPFDDTGASITLDLPSSNVVVEMPFGEQIKSLYFYLGYLVIGTNKGIRVATVQTDGSVVYGPLIVETGYDVTGFVANDRYVWGATTVAGDGAYLNAVLIRIDLSTPFQDGTFPYAYDLQYQSDEDSYGVGVHYANDRLHILTNEGAMAGEVQTEKLSDKRASGWMETGYIRHATVEPKFFKYLKLTGSSSAEDSISITTVDSNGTEYDIVDIGSAAMSTDIGALRPSTGQEMLAFKFTLNNASPVTNTPTITSYQIKSVPGVKRQRLVQYPLSCFDTEMDRFDVQFGYTGRAYALLTQLEELEEVGDFVTIRDFRNNEQYQGIIEEVRFTSESSSDKNNSGYGGLILITVRKM